MSTHILTDAGVDFARDVLADLQAIETRLERTLQCPDSYCHCAFHGAWRDVAGAIDCLREALGEARA